LIYDVIKAVGCLLFALGAKNLQPTAKSNSRILMIVPIEDHIDEIVLEMTSG
jgi:hypothetical protein